MQTLPGLPPGNGYPPYPRYELRLIADTCLAWLFSGCVTTPMWISGYDMHPMGFYFALKLVETVLIHFNIYCSAWIAWFIQFLVLLALLNCEFGYLWGWVSLSSIQIYAALLHTQGKQCSFGISTPLRHFMWIATCPQLWDYVTVVHRQQ
jgi:hypothetical protein